MDSPRTSIDQLTPAQREVVEELTARFERDWKHGARPCIDDYLRHPGQRLALLVALVRIDLVQRTLAGEPARSASYVERYPELARFRAALAVFDEPVVLPSGAAAAAFVTSAPGAAEPVAGRSALLSACLQRWYDLKAQAQPPMPEDLCREHPELLEEVKQRIEGVAAIEALLGAVNDHLDRTQPGQLPDDRWNTLAAAPGVAPLPARPSPGGDAETAPAQVPGYELVGKLGEGGMGVVYKARHLKLNRLVALKMVRAGGHAGSEELRRFLAEAEAVAALQHPNIVQVFEIGQHDGLPYMALEYVNGGSLADRLRAGLPLPKEAAWLVEQLAHGMAAAHAKGIIHRDLKPANVLLRGKSEIQNPKSEEDLGLRIADLEPKVTDFGLARKVEGGSGMTQTGAVMGTPSYMAPEQAQGKKDVGPVADVYALGAILYECLTGRPPFRGPTLLDTIRQVEAAEPAAVRQLQPGCPRDLETIAHKCLQKEPGKRYASAAELAEDLRRYQAGEPITARPVGALERGVKWVRRKPVVAGLTALVVLVLVAGSLVAWGLAVWALGEKGRADSQASAAGQAKQRADDQAEVAERKAEEAQKEKLRADGEAQEARAANKRADHQLAIAELRLYASKLAQAQQQWKDYNAARALELLDECQQDLRHVEHRHLSALFNSNQRTLRGHTNQVSSVAVSPDGKRILSGSYDNTVKLWDAGTGQQVFSLQGHTAAVTSVAFSPDGKRIATGGNDNTVRVWDTARGRELFSLKHVVQPASVAFSPDGKRVLTGSRDGSIQAWDTDKSLEVFSVKGHTGVVTCVAYSPDGTRILSGSYDAALKLWDPANGREVLSLRGHMGEVTSAAFSSDGKRIVSGSADHTMKLWDAQQGQELLSLKGHTGMVNGVALSADGKRIVSGSGDGTVKVWEAVKGQQLLSLKGHTRALTSVALSPDAKLIVSGSYDTTVKLWDADKDQEVRSLLGHSGLVSGVAPSPDGKRIFSGGADGTVRLWDTATGRQLLLLRGHTGVVTSVAVSADGKRLASGSADKTVTVWDAGKGLALLSLKGHTGRVTSVALSSDGNRVVSGSYDGRVKVWNGAKEVFSLDGHAGQVYAVALSADGTRVVSGGYDKTVRVWDSGKGQELLSLKGHTGLVWSVALSADGKRILSGSGDGTVKVWDAVAGTELLTLKGHTAAVTGVASSADGKRILSCSDDQTVKVWDAGKGVELLTLRGHSDRVTCVAIAADSKRMLSGSHDGTVKVWDADQGQEPPSAK